MGCRCERNGEYRVGRCDVCVRVRNDLTAKPVRYCSVCKAWLCEDCERDWWARARAAVLKLLGKHMEA